MHHKKLKYAAVKIFLPGSSRNIRSRKNMARTQALPDYSSQVTKM